MRLDRTFAQLRQSARSLARTPGFVVTTVAMLGIAIGATAGLFAVVDKVLIDPLPFREPDRLVVLTSSAPGTAMQGEFGPSLEFYLHYRDHAKGIEDLGSTNSFTNTLRAVDRVERVRMSTPTNSLFTTLGVTPQLGRLPVDADEDRTAVISHALWQSWFGGRADVLGKTIHAGGGERTIIGVMKPDFQFPNADTMLWISGHWRPADVEQVGEWGMGIVARMAPGTTPETLATELTRLSKEVPARFGGDAAYQRIVEQHRAHVHVLGDRLLGPVSRPLWILLASGVLVLLIACANVANLFLVRTEARHRELAMRRALGAGRAQLVASTMREAVIVATLAGVVALVLAAIVVPLLVQAAPAGIPRLADVRVGFSTVAFTAVLAAMSALICGLVPAWRSASPDLSRLREAGRGSTGRAHWVRNTLVVGQTALALVLLVVSGLMLRSAQQMLAVDPGYDARDVFTFQMAPEREELQDPVAMARFNLAFLERLKQLPDVERVGIIENVPIDEGVDTMRVTAEGATGDAPYTGFTYTAGDYFQTMGIPLRAGRVFTDDDHLGARGTVIVSQLLAEQLWPGQDPIGKRLRREGGTSWETVVGVVGNVLQESLTEPAQPLAYFPMVAPDAATRRPIVTPGYVIKTRNAESIAPVVRALVREVAPEAPMYRTYTMAGLVDSQMQQVQFTMLTLMFAAGLALVLGAVGLYGTLSYAVAERTREIGVRMALGARAGQVRTMVVAQGARLVGAGVVIGLALAGAAAQAMGSLLFGVTPFDLPTFLVTTIAMALVGFIASYLPARAASNLDPMISLRRD